MTGSQKKKIQFPNFASYNLTKLYFDVSVGPYWVCELLGME